MHESKQAEVFFVFEPNLSKVAQTSLEQGESGDPIVAQVTAALAELTGQDESLSVSRRLAHRGVKK